MATPSAPHAIVTSSQHMSANGSPAPEPVLLDTPRDDIPLESAAQFIPSTRTIELEALLRQRDAQNEKLTIEVMTLRRFLAKQPTPSASEPVTLPPPLLSLLLPYMTDPLAAEPSSSSSNSVMVALTQRAKLLQEENDELYDLLKHSETGRLKEEVRGLRRAMKRMEGALTESHGIIKTLSIELDKCYETLSRTSDVYPSDGPSQTYSDASAHARGNVNHGPSSSGGRPIPTGPRAQKRPRLSHPSVSPQQPPRPLPTPHRRSASPRRAHVALPSNARHVSASLKMEVDEDTRGRGRASPDRDRDRDRHRERVRDRDRDHERGRELPPHPGSRRSRERERERNRERDRDRDRERERVGRRNGGGGRDRRGARGNPGTNGTTGSRGLVERMGL